jgi:hypothetical protein
LSVVRSNGMFGAWQCNLIRNILDFSTISDAMEDRSKLGSTVLYLGANFTVSTWGGLQLSLAGARDYVRDLCG